MRWINHLFSCLFQVWCQGWCPPWQRNKTYKRNKLKLHIAGAFHLSTAKQGRDDAVTAKKTKVLWWFHSGKFFVSSFFFSLFQEQLKKCTLLWKKKISSWSGKVHHIFRRKGKSVKNTWMKRGADVTEIIGGFYLLKCNPLNSCHHAKNILISYCRFPLWNSYLLKKVIMSFKRHFLVLLLI